MSADYTSRAPISITAALEKTGMHIVEASKVLRDGVFASDGKGFSAHFAQCEDGTLYVVVKGGSQNHDDWIVEMLGLSR